MSTVYLIPDDPGLDVLAFHVTTGEFHTANSTLTDNPVEDGSIITDHIIHDPAVFSFEATITESPHTGDFYGNGEDVSIDAGVPSVVAPGVVLPTSVSVRGFGRPDWRDKNLVREMFDRLEALRFAAVTCTVLTSMHEYESMILVHHELPRGPLSLGSGSFKIDTRGIAIVSTETVAAPKPKEPRGAKSQAKGSQAEKDLETQAKEFVGKLFNRTEGKSVLATWLDK